MAKILDRELPERSLIRFMYPSANSRKSRITLTLPFFENPIIQETGRATYSKYDLLSRSGEMFTFGGSKSRRIKLTFNLTLPHIRANNKEPLYRYMQYGTSNPDEKAKMRMDMRMFLEPSVDVNIEKAPLPFFRNRSVEDDTVRLITWWVNVIRSSTTNNTRNPKLGPPIIILKHGPLYRDAKFICEGYEIAGEEVAGYELASLLNRRIMVTMNLAEVKAGDFEDYKPGDEIKGDNLTGWDSLLDYGIMDPANDLARQVEDTSTHIAEHFYLDGGIDFDTGEEISVYEF